MTTTPPTKIVVIGGGYAGTLAANHLHKNGHAEITLVNPRPTFVERIRLHQLAAGSGSAEVDYSQVLNPKTRLVIDEATEIDTTKRRVRLASGGGLDYDFVIYAVGSTAAPPQVPGAAEFVFWIAEYEYAQRLRQRLTSVDANDPICVVGGGLTGIETAAELAQHRSAVTLICGEQLGAALSSGARGSVRRQLRKLGVTILEGTTVTAVQPEAVTLSDAREVPSTVTVWTAGFGSPKLAARSGLATDALGRLLTDEALTSIDDPRIIAAGDAASPSGLPLRMSCQAALPLGAKAADTVLDRIAGREPADVSQMFVGQFISLGRSHGTSQFTRTDDTPLPLHLGGRLAATIKEFVCKSTVKVIAKEARKPGSYFWPRGGKRRVPQEALEA